MFFTHQQKCNNISDFRLGAFLSAFGGHDVQSFMLQGGQIFCPTEMGNEIFLKGGCTWSLKKSKKIAGMLSI